MLPVSRVGFLVIGVLKLSLYIPESGSLKGKRKVIKSLKDRLRSQFNVSVSEVDKQDLWQRADVAVVIVSPDRVHVDRVLQTILGKVESWRLAEVIEVEMEII